MWIGKYKQESNRVKLEVINNVIILSIEYIMINNYNAKIFIKS